MVDFDKMLRESREKREAAKAAALLVRRAHATVIEADPFPSAPDKGLQLHDLSPDQKSAFDTIMSWVRFNEHSQPILTLGGFAGTGKSTILGVVAKHSGVVPIAFCAYTGKASSVLRRKLKDQGILTRARVNRTARDEGPDGYYAAAEQSDKPFCGTIHSLIYQPIVDPKSGRIEGWVQREELDAPYKLIVIDESSMVSDEMLSDLRNYGVQILAVGDHGQLPPVAGMGTLMRNPDIRLEKIHRQAEGNPIIKLSAVLRQTGKFDRKYADGKHIQFKSIAVLRPLLQQRYTKAEPSELMKMVTLCYTNRRRAMVNALTRGLMLRSGPPKHGELVMCLRNNKDMGVYNGMRGIITETRGRHPRWPWQMQNEVDFVEDDVRAVVTMCAQQFGREKTFSDFEELEAAIKETAKAVVHINNWTAVGGLYDFGYAMTVHKCVAPETLIETPNGLEMIGDVSDLGAVAVPSGRKPYTKVLRNPVGPMISITTRDGYNIKVTPYHGLDVWNAERGYIRKEAKDIIQYDMVRLRLSSEFDAPNARLLTPNSPDVRAHLYSLPTMVNDDVALFLGLMVADGTIYDGGFRLAKRHKEVADTFTDLCVRLFGATPSRFFTLNAHHVEVSSSYIVSWLREIGGMNPNNKDVPRCILKSSNRAQAMFLRGLFEDGTVNLQDEVFDHIELYSVFDAVCRKVRIMLLRLGIITSTTMNRPGCIYIYRDGVDAFKERIGFISEFKASRLPDAVGKGRYPVPFTQEELNQLAKAVGKRSNLPQSARNAFTTGFMSRAACMKMVSELPTSIQTLIGGKLGFHHSRVLSMNTYEGASVCLSVPDGHQFIQDGFCGWNSQGSSMEDVLVIAERPGPVDADTWARWAYTAATRSSRKLTILE